jgi:hypothetical protein
MTRHYRKKVKKYLPTIRKIPDDIWNGGKGREIVAFLKDSKFGPCDEDASYFFASNENKEIKENENNEKKGCEREFILTSYSS